MYVIQIIDLPLTRPSMYDINVPWSRYAKGFAQLIHSPTTWTNNPMIINTNKRITNDTSPGPIGGPQPRNSLAPPNADYQGILE